MEEPRPEVYEWRTRVRSYELDAYGHVNNAVYAQWLEHARCAMLMAHGLDYYVLEARWGVRYVLVSSHLDFEAGLVLDDGVVVKTKLASVGRTSFRLAQEIWREDPGDGQRAARAAIAVVFTDPTMRSAAPVPAEFRELFGSPRTA